MEQRRYEPQYNLQPSNTLYGYADPRYIPPAESPEPIFKQYPQPFYPPNAGPQRDPRDPSRDPAEPYSPRKFDYHLDDRFYRVPPQPVGYDQGPPQQYQQGYDRSPRHDPGYNYDRSPRHDYGGYDRSPRQEYQDGGRHNNYDPRRPGYDVVPPAGRANSYSTRITDLLTSIREPQQKDDSLVRMMEANKGYLVMMRFDISDLPDVITAVQENLGTIHAQNGYVIGFSTPDRIRVLIANNEMEARRHREWTRSGVCCFWFKDVFQAKFWFESAHRLKQPDFPNSHSYEVIAVPLTYGRNKEPMPFTPTDDPVTLLWCEFPHIYERSHHDFLENYSDPARLRMKDFGANPHVSLCKFKAGWPDLPNKYGQPGYGRQNVVHERYARAIKAGWVIPDSFITVSTFPNMTALHDFFYDDVYQRKYRNRLDNYTNPVFVAITLVPVTGTKNKY